MKPVSRYMVRHATALVREIDANAVLVLADALESDTELRQLVNTINFRTILISRSHDPASTGKLPHCEWITIPDVHMTRTCQLKVVLLVCLAKGLLQRGDQVVCLVGIDGSSVIDTCMVLNLGFHGRRNARRSAVFTRCLLLLHQATIVNGNRVFPSQHA